MPLRTRRRTRAARALLAASAAATLACAHAWHGPPTDHFDGRRFASIDPIRLTLSDRIRRMLTRRQRPWEEHTEAPPGERPPARVAAGAVRVTLINHATVLVQLDGVNVLTDPTWAKRAVPILGAKRRRPPGIRFEDLPPIDAVLVSHDHHDHMDVPTLRRLAARFRPAFVTGLGNARYLARRGIPGGRDLDWWQRTEIGPGVSVTAVPARHSSGRGVFDRNRTLWCGFVVEGPSGSVLFAGDTGFGSHFAMIAARFPRLTAALLPIGGFVPEWYMHQQHMGPRDAVRAAEILGAGAAIPMHFGTFPVSDDAETDPTEGLREALGEGGGPKPRFAVLGNGESVTLPSSPE